MEKEEIINTNINEDIKIGLESIPVLPMSKNALKRMKEKEVWESKKNELKKLKKMKKKEKKKLKNEINDKEKIEAKSENLQNIEIPSISNKTTPIVFTPRKEREQQFLKLVENGIKLIIDCEFEDLMSEKNISSMVRQISDCYSVNKYSANPFNLILYDVGENLYTNLAKNNLEKWIGIKCVKKGEFESLKEFINKSYQNSTSITDFNSKQIVYLTADSSNEINELKQDEIYIIGGIVDRNRYKFLTINKADNLGINHGKLPIGEYIDMKSTKVLTTNHVFSILSYFHSKEQNWKEAFLSIIPKRKFE